MREDDHIPASGTKLLEPVPLPREPWDIRDKIPAQPKIFSTRLYAPSEQFEVWKTRMSPLTDVGLPQGTSAAHGFDVELMTCKMADMVLTSGHFAAQTFARAPEPAHGASIEHWWLFRLRSGELWLEAGERQLHVRPGEMFLMSLDDDFRGRTGDCEILLLSLPRRVFTGVADELDRACNTSLSGNLVGLLADYLTTLEIRVVDMTPDELKQAGHATAELVAACIQPSPDRLEQARGSIESLLFERARLYIEAHLGEFDLSPERVAQELRISRSNLYRAFESVGGVARFILRKRLHAAHEELIGSAEKQVQEIAYRHGFKLASDFARAYRREFGMSPRDARERARHR